MHFPRFFEPSDGPSKQASIAATSSDNAYIMVASSALSRRTRKSGRPLNFFDLLDGIWNRTGLDCNLPSTSIVFRES